MSCELPFDLIELAPCPALSVPVLQTPLRETAFREDAWLPEDIDTLRAMFVADEDIEAIAARLARRLAGVRSKISELGLRRNSVRPWSELDNAYLSQHYGDEAASAIAAALGRSVTAIYARAKLMDLTEAGALPYTEWELVQVRAGYAQGVPIAQLGVLIGRPVSGIASTASRLGIKHANGAPDWSGAEQQRALELAEAGLRYPAIAERLATENFPRRSGRTVGQTLRRLGYGRGWGRLWISEEDDLLRDAYAQGKSLTPLRDRLGRSRTSISYRAGELGLRCPAGPHEVAGYAVNEVGLEAVEIVQIRFDLRHAQIGPPHQQFRGPVISAGIVHEVRVFRVVPDRLAQHAGHHPFRSPLHQSEREAPPDAVAHKEELPDTEVVHEPQLVVGECAPRVLDLDRAAGFAAIRVSLVHGDAAEVVFEGLHGVEHGGGPVTHARVQAPARGDQKGEAAANFLVANTDIAFLIKRHARPLDGTAPPR